MSDNLQPILDDEARVPPYTLPAVLKAENGDSVTNAQEWRDRRVELLQLFEEQVYGKTPTFLPTMEFATVNRGIWNGTATRKQITLRFERNGRKARLKLLVYLPAQSSGPVPLFLGLNFRGNHTVCADPEVEVAEFPLAGPNNSTLSTDAAARGSMAHRWPIETILARGYGVATACYHDLFPDLDEFQDGFHALFYRAGQTRPDPDEWGAIGVWAWGLSRALDYLQTDPDVDASRVALVGHSRLGKTALWAGAQDERFALVISNNSGCGGASLSRHCVGETLGYLNSQRLQWFCANYHRYNDRINELPVDQHELLALIAPRPLYVASAANDRGADPPGEFLSTFHADPVYQLLGVPGLNTRIMPPVDSDIRPTGRIAYHIRSGEHAITEEDWSRFLDFADAHL